LVWVWQCSAMCPNFPVKTGSVSDVNFLTNEFVISQTCSYFEALDLCSLDAASKKISTSYSTSSAWSAIAKFRGLNLLGVDKTSIKSVCGAIHNIDLNLASGLGFELSTKGALELARAAEHMEQMRRSMHLGAGASEAVTFVQRFYFDEDDVDLYIDDPDMTEFAVSSNPIVLTIGNATYELSLTWHASTMWLTMHSTKDADASFKPFLVRLRTVSCPLCMRKDFKVFKPHSMQKGDGLCCVLDTPDVLADHLEDGILCVGIVYDLHTALMTACRSQIFPASGETAQALQLDAPGWRAALLQNQHI